MFPALKELIGLRVQTGLYRDCRVNLMPCKRGKCAATKKDYKGGGSLKKPTGDK